MGKKLRIFDFDNTLVTTTSKIHVVSKDGIKTSYTTAGFATDYKQQPGDQVDFTEFKDNKLRNPTEIPEMVTLFKMMSKRQSSMYKTVILTARGNHTPIKAWLARIGIGNVFVVALSTTQSSMKALWIEQQITRGFTDIHFYDDSLDNVTEVKRLIKKYPQVNFVIKHVTTRR